MPLWVTLGASLSTGAYGPREAIVMAVPLLLAAGVEIARLDLGRYHRWLEVSALVFFLLDFLRGQGVFPVVIHTLFVLGGVRLILPREIPQRRQLVLIGFLLFLTTTVSTTDFAFVLWTLVWMGAAMVALLQQTWEQSAQLRRGPLLRAPYARIPLWMSLALLFSTGCFLVIPRVSAGLRPALISGLAASGQAGLSDSLDLGVGGPIEPNPAVVVRIVPGPGANPAALGGLSLLRGLVLESIRGQRWVPSEWTPPLRLQTPSQADLQAEFLFSPSPRGILALPDGLTSLTPSGAPLRPGFGASLRWLSPRTRTIPLLVSWDPRPTGRLELRLPPRRLQELTALAPEHEAARRWSLRLAPASLPTEALARQLETRLRAFRYTLDNPSGHAANPLEDFLERTQAGHCEYFASAMALMLRARGVPARVVNGYRLGPWIPEGGYFRVSQNEAHSWVEYWDAGYWKTADPTPAAEAGSASAGSKLDAVTRWLDTLRYQWDRHVVRFSAQDQEECLSWIQTRIQGWEWHWKAPSPSVALTAGVVIFTWMVWRFRGRWRARPGSPEGVRALRPLLRCTRRYAPPQPGDTARIWLLRLGELRQERLGTLVVLADAVDAHAYGRGSAALGGLLKAEVAAWRGWRPSR
ncbi:MAG TPA: transglutaminaseTgpA domain-containing protein [Geothrix sp.]|nr:transglutaminaseTgpA domain-containing protein [Geothrix sp.]